MGHEILRNSRVTVEPLHRHLESGEFREVHLGRMPRKIRAKFRPIIRPEFRPVTKICRRSFALGRSDQA